MNNVENNTSNHATELTTEQLSSTGITGGMPEVRDDFWNSEAYLSAKARMMG